MYVWHHLHCADSVLPPLLLPMQWFVRQTAEVENNMTCVERMLDYTALPSEPPRQDEGGGDPPRHWPRTGEKGVAEMCGRVT